MLSLLRNWVASGERSAIVTLHAPTLALNFCDKLPLLADEGVLGPLEPKQRKPESQLNEYDNRGYRRSKM